MGFLDYIFENKAYLVGLLFEHLKLTGLAVIVAIFIGVPLGIFINRFRKMDKPVLGITNLIQAIPSLALLGFLIPFLGIGTKPAILMVVLYSLLPIIKNTHAGLQSINPETVEAAKGIGLTKMQILFKVKIPMALPIIMAGVRISAVTAVGLMTIAAFIGAGGLGEVVFAGIQTVDNNKILAGAIPACILALLLDFLISKIETIVTPISLRKNVKKEITKQYIIRDKKKKRAMVYTSIALLVLILGGTTIKLLDKTETIVIGSKNFSEQLILANMYADLIEEHTDIEVERKFNLGGTQITWNGMINGEIDMYVEYTGTTLMGPLKLEPEYDPDLAYDKVKEVSMERYNIEWLEPIGFNNTYTIAVTKELAEKYGIETISDLAKVSNQMIFSPTIEFANREDAIGAVEETYGIKFKEIKTVDGALRYKAIINGESQAIDAFRTDGLVKSFDLKVLEDDKSAFVPYYAAPIVRAEVLEENEELRDIFNMLEGKIDGETMSELNYKVDELKEDPSKVAREFLIENKLIKE